MRWVHECLNWSRHLAGLWNTDCQLDAPSQCSRCARASQPKSTPSPVLSLACLPRGVGCTTHLSLPARRAGKYPLETVYTIASICRAAEAVFDHSSHYEVRVCAGIDRSSHCEVRVCTGIDSSSRHKVRVCTGINHISHYEARVCTGIDRSSRHELRVCTGIDRTSHCEVRVCTGIDRSSCHKVRVCTGIDRSLCHEVRVCRGIDHSSRHNVWAEWEQLLPISVRIYTHV